MQQKDIIICLANEIVIKNKRMSLDYIRVELPELYPYVMLTAGTIAFQCLLIGFGAGGSRGEYFTKNEAIKEKYNEEH